MVAELEIVEQDAPPAKRLAAEPEVSSPEEIDVALCELSWLESRRQTVTAACEQAIQLLKSQADAKLKVKVGRQTVSFQERETVLRAAVAKYCREHRHAIIDAKKKSRQFPHGSIAFRLQKPKVAYAEGQSKQTVAETLNKLTGSRTETGIVERLWKLLRRVRLFGKINAGALFKLTVEPNLQGIKDALANKQIAASDLKSLGLEFQPGGETCAITVAEYTVEPEAKDVA